jgi:pimeloyl-ACP methyl ester carboxylesterase
MEYIARRAFTVAALACLFAVLATPALSSPFFSWEDYARPHQLVDIGGRRLNLFCLGSGSPTVILDAGLGDDISAWRKVQGEIAGTTRVCAYDRAGYGFSDPAVLPRDAIALSKDLERLIRAARSAPPYVIVGGSIAALHTRLFVDAHLRDVVGVVLVDPSFEHQVAEYERATPAFRRSAQQQLATYRSCIVELRHGTPPVGSKVWKDCVGDPEPDLPPAVTKALVARITPSFYRMALSELSEFEGESSDEVDRSRRSWGDLPLIVLTAGGTTKPDRDQAVRNAIWFKAHDRIAALSAHGTNRMVPGATHHIQLSRPHAVISAVKEVIAAWRGHSNR